jgi:hypothetical protein
MKLITLLYAVTTLFAVTAFADSDLRVIWAGGQLAEIYTANVQKDDGRWLHTARITPLVMNLGTRLWCDGKELLELFIDDAVTSRYTDNQEIGKLGMVFLCRW